MTRKAGKGCVPLPQGNKRTVAQRMRGRIQKKRGRLVDKLVDDLGGCWCFYCGVSYEKDEITIDHLHPLSRGGTNDYENLVLACGSCNVWKDNRIARIDEDGEIVLID